MHIIIIHLNPYVVTQTQTRDTSSRFFVANVLLLWAVSSTADTELNQKIAGNTHSWAQESRKTSRTRRELANARRVGEPPIKHTGEPENGCESERKRARMTNRLSESAFVYYKLTCERDQNIEHVNILELIDDFIAFNKKWNILWSFWNN